MIYILAILVIPICCFVNGFIKAWIADVKQSNAESKRREDAAQKYCDIFNAEANKRAHDWLFKVEEYPETPVDKPQLRI